MVATIALLIVAAVVLALVLWTDTATSDYLTGTAPSLATGLNTQTMALFVNNITFDYSTTLGMLTEASFPGYARVSVSGATPGVVSGKTIPVTTSPAVFTRSSTGTPQTAYGYYLLDGLGQLIGGGTFPSPGPYVFANASDSLSIPVTVSLTAVP